MTLWASPGEHSCRAEHRSRSTCTAQQAMNGAEVLLYDTSSAQGVLQQTYQLCSDPVHGTIVLGPICSLATSTTPVFRLRKLTQLGTTCFGPHPAAEHTRFPHCLGVAHLSRQCMQHLAETGADDVSPLDIELTSLAGLCHDLGHGPFSHSFETFLERVLGHGHKWRHEQMSCQLLEYAVQEAGLDLATHELQRVQDMIDNGLRQPQPNHQPWRMQVISNEVSGLDMDKVDYEIRDVLMARLELEQDCRQLIPLVTQHCKVLAGHICFDQQWQQQVAQVFDLRAALHKRMYQHQQGKAAEAMLTDAFVLADPQLGISDKIHDPEEFLTLDDSLVDAIQRAARRKGADANMVQAAGILKRLQRRDTMYQPAGEAELPAHAERGSSLTVDHLVRYQTPTSPVTLKQEDLRLQHFSISHGLGAEDPLERIFLYDEHDNITKKAADGITRPKSFLTKMVRVYVAKLCCSPQEQQAYVDAAHAAFSRAVQEAYGPHVKLSNSSSGGGGSSSSGSAIKSAATAAVELRSAAAALLQQGRDLQAHRAAGNGSHRHSLGGDSSSSSQALAWLSGRASVVEAPSGDLHSYGNGVVQCWRDVSYQC